MSLTKAHLQTEDIVRAVTSDLLAEAELNRLSVRLKEIPEFKRDPEGALSDYVRNLVERRAELLKRRRIQRQVPPTHRYIDWVLPNLSDLLWPWEELSLPNFAEGINETPGTNGTDGQIVTAGLFQGGLAYGGTPTDDGVTNPHTEKWWIHNWTCNAVFPAATFQSRLYYRFTVDSECHVYLAPVYSGSISEFVTVGTTADSGQPITNQNTVGWLVDVTLPYSGSLNFGTPVPVSGSIDVDQGTSAALGLIYGTIVSAASGYVQFLWGNFGTRRNVAAGQTIGASDYGKIEYRFEPRWWVDAVIRRLNLSIADGTG